MTTDPTQHGANDRQPPVPVPLVLHVGLHKTGTTWLQESLYRPHSGTAFEYSEDRALLRGNFLVTPDAAFSPAVARAEFDEMFARAEARGCPVVLNDELLAALPFRSSFVRAGVTDRLAATFPNAKILLTIREQVSIIASSYGHYLRGGNTASLAEFLFRPKDEEARLWQPVMSMDHFDYDHLLSSYEARFGQGNVLIAPMEWMIANPEGLREKLSHLTGTEWPKIEPDATRKVVNPASSYLAYAVMRQLNRFYSEAAVALHGSTLPYKAAYWVDRITPASHQKRAKDRNVQLIRDSVGDYYRASNRRLGERTGIDLAAFGYAT